MSRQRLEFEQNGAHVPQSAAEAPSRLRLLGGATVIQVGPGSPLEWVSSIRRGFPIQTLDSLAANIQATPTELAQLLNDQIPHSVAETSFELSADLFVRRPVA